MDSLVELLASGVCLLKELDITGSGILDEEAVALGRSLHKNTTYVCAQRKRARAAVHAYADAPLVPSILGRLRVLKADKMVLEPQ